MSAYRDKYIETDALLQRYAAKVERDHKNKVIGLLEACASSALAKPQEASVFRAVVELLYWRSPQEGEGSSPQTASALPWWKRIAVGLLVKVLGWRANG